MKKNTTTSRLAYFRKQAGFTQVDLANEVGVPPQWISKIERGEINIHNISLCNGLKLSAALNINAWELVR